ncbi:ATP-binding protein [uncultured Methanobrevibacter sp.]|uniref:ATP-binding protein n=1 Tax=uncultured Methanobrevibacter sp. TaxID=253161 RepID=UPI0025FB03C5|nr:ATP-binding protein [uncultured Methanobrevibacter sp.]
MTSITLKPELSQLNTLNQFISNELGKENLQVNLIVEEIFVNIINYSKTDIITVNVEFDDNTVTLEFIDNGIEFNPLLTEDPETSDNIDEVKIGGLGIFLTKQMSDDMSYEYKNSENHLKIVKNVKE